MWNGLSDAKKALFQKQAADLKEKHYKDYPDWKWSNKDRKRYAYSPKADAHTVTYFF